MSYDIKYLGCGLVVIRDMVSGLAGLYGEDGTHRSGELILPAGRVLALIAW